jgi:predicted dehydrogenase
MAQDKSGLSRREFIGRGVVAGVGFGLSGSLWGLKMAKGDAAPSARIRIGCIGLGGQANGAHLPQLLRMDTVAITAVCDVDTKRCAAAADRVEKADHPRPFASGHYEDVLARNDVDAVLIATPDHWHATIAIHACRAGKDVYVEKPMTHDITEGRLLVNTARELNRVVQLGTQQRAGREFKQAVAIVRSGLLGEIKSTRAWKAARVLDINNPTYVKQRANPADLDWDRWLGPSPARAFDPYRVHYCWRYFWDQGGGLMTDWGVHMIDIIQWAMRSEKPLTVEATGTRAEHSPMEVPYSIDAHYQFPGFTMAWQQGKMEIDPNKQMTDHGIAFIGSEGQCYVCRPDRRFSCLQTFPASIKTATIPDEAKVPDRGSHWDDFLDAVRTRTRPNADVAMGHTSTTTANLGNIAYRIGRKLTWDGDKEQFVGDEEANGYLKHVQRAPYTI